MDVPARKNRGGITQRTARDLVLRIALRIVEESIQTAADEATVRALEEIRKAVPDFDADHLRATLHTAIHKATVASAQQVAQDLSNEVRKLLVDASPRTNH